jgi:DNA processing protein
MNGYKLTTPLNHNYPDNLRILQKPPGLLYYKGKLLKKDQKAISIVGTRNPSQYGIKAAKYFTKNLAKEGFTIVSGLARGIDTIAHKSALNAGTRTIAIMGSGIDVIYPPENTALFNHITQNGAVITEFKENTPPLAKNFLYRNRLIAAISVAVIVIEGALKSGTLSTASYAANLGRDVYAVPGSIFSKTSQGTNYLLKQGAFVATSPKDILDNIL